MSFTERVQGPTDTLGDDLLYGQSAIGFLASFRVRTIYGKRRQPCQTDVYARKRSAIRMSACIRISSSSAAIGAPTVGERYIVSHGIKKDKIVSK